MRGVTVSAARYASLVALAIGLLFSRTAFAQLSAQSTNSTGSSCSGGSDGNGDCRFSTSELIKNSTQYKVRYAWNVNADVGILSTRDESGSATHHVLVTAVAPGAYQLSVVQSFVGDINLNGDAPGCDGRADVTGVSGSQTGGTVSGGTLSISDPGQLSGGGTQEIPFSNSANATIVRTSNGVAGNHTLTFTWSGSVRSNSCEAAVRLGESSGNTSGCSACGYPGSPSRTQSNDGHFVTVTFTSLCGNGVVDGSVGEQCDQGIDNGSSTSCCTSNCQFVAGGTICRPAAGVCDVAEACNGISGACGFDFKYPNTHGCRAANGQCDQAEFCDGVSNDCPPDTFLPPSTVCRAGSAGQVCDVTEFCTGTGPNCPPDQVQPAGRPAAQRPGLAMSPKLAMGRTRPVRRIRSSRAPRSAARRPASAT